MFFRPGRQDVRVIGLYVARVILGIGVVELVPAGVAVVLGEWNAASALGIGAALALIAGQVGARRLYTRRRLDWSHGMVVAALSWLVGAAFAAVPLYLSGHVSSFLDAVFEAMSGLTTSGLSVVEDLDHLAVSMNLWRHVLHFVGGQGIVVVVLGVFATGVAQAGTLYVGEGRDERIVPNVVRTARFIYVAALVYLVIGTATLWLAGRLIGLSPGRALSHGVMLFMAAFDTGGFSPNSSSIAYYHSAVYETVLAFLMLAGAMSFGLHYQLWRRRWRELTRHTETRTLAVSLTVTSLLVLVGLAVAGTYGSPAALYRKGFFSVLSAHTGTGFAVTSGALFESDWGAVAPAGIVAAMALGGMAGSTAGGIKAVRVAIAALGIRRDIARVARPPAALSVTSYHLGTDRILTDEQIRSAVTVLLLYLITYIGGGLVGILYGYDFTAAFFESTSAAANVGLSVGIVSPTMPAPLELTYIAQMWLGRLEFLAAIVLVGFMVTAVTGRVGPTATSQRR